MAERVMIIDCQLAGIAGDMFLAALLSLSQQRDEVIKKISAINNVNTGFEKFRLDIRDIKRKGIQALKVDVNASETHDHRTGIAVKDAILKCATELSLSPKATDFALKTTDTLIKAEGKIHGESPENVHLHEAGSIDTVVDIVGTAILLDELRLHEARICSTPVAVGGGLFTFSHGTVTSPGPATLEILRAKNVPLVGGPINFELTTPTGASILVNLINEATPFYPEIKPSHIGYGAGAKDFAEIPNVLRVIVGESPTSRLSKDELCVLETNLDDVSGEIVGHTLDKLIQEGAKDVSIIPMFTKKNRPGQILKVLANPTDSERLSRIMIRETGTLGVRSYPCIRHILNREFVSIDVVIGDLRETVKVKVAKDTSGAIIQIKPEYSEIKRIAEDTNKPLREIMDIVKAKATEILSKGDF